MRIGILLVNEQTGAYTYLPNECVGHTATQGEGWVAVHHKFKTELGDKLFVLTTRFDKDGEYTFLDHHPKPPIGHFFGMRVKIDGRRIGLRA